MTLDRSTYEAWLLDRLEGHLTPEQERQLDAFLAANPDLPVTLGELPSVSGSETAFGAKDALKKDHPPAGEPDASRLDDFLVARLEGDLSAVQVQQLGRFLYEHPEFEQEAKRMAASRVQRDPVEFPAKGTIERHFPPQGSPDKHRLTDFLIAAEEGDLDVEQRAALDGYIAAYPEAERERRLVKASRVERRAIMFAAKERLKKRETRVIALWPRLAAAASIALLVGLAWWMLRDRSIGGEAPIARNEQPQVPVAPVAVPPDVDRTVPVNARKNEATTPASSEGSGGAAPFDGNTRPSTAQPDHGSARPGTAPAGGRPAQPEPRMKDVLPIDPVVTPAPELAHAPEPAPVKEAPATGTPPEEAPALASTDDNGRGQSLAVAVANAVRDGVLEEPKRDRALDGTDAVAAVDKGLGALTGGTGGLQVQRTGARERMQLRLGRNLAISASRDR